MESRPYLAKPVWVGDGDVVNPEAPVAAAAVGDAGQGREVAVQVDVLSVAAPTRPAI